MKNIAVLLSSVLVWAATPCVAIAQGCYDSSITSPTPFMGNNGEIFRLADGSIWEVKYEYQYLYEYYPTVRICPDRGILIVRGTALNVQRITTADRPPSAQPGAASARGSPQLQVLPNDDFSFYDSYGRATAYFDLSGEIVVYLWSGEPVAYLDGESVFGFNGRHLGWYHNGLIYDGRGGIVVAPASAFRESPGPPASVDQEVQAVEGPEATETAETSIRSDLVKPVSTGLLSPRCELTKTHLRRRLSVPDGAEPLLLGRLPQAPSQVAGIAMGT